MDDFVHYAYIELQPFYNLGFRLGRNPLDIFLLSDYRNVGFAYAWVRPMTGMYSTLFADFYEGAQVMYSKSLDCGDVSVAAYAGSLDIHLPLSELGCMDFSYEPLVGINLRYTRDAFKFIAGYQRGEIGDLSSSVGHFSSVFKTIPENIIPPAPYVASYMDLNGSYCDYFSLGVAYDDNSWIIQSELSQYRFEKALGLTYNSGYISVGYRWKNFVPFISYSKLYNSIGFIPFSEYKKNKENIALLTPEMLQALVDLGSLNRDVDAHQDTLSLGLRWNIGNNYALKLQWDHNWIKKANANSVGQGQTILWETDPTIKIDKDQEVNVFSVSFDFFF